MGVLKTDQPAEKKTGRRLCRYGAHCGDISSDGRNPHGIAKMFYTAHHAVLPNQTRMYVDKLAALKNLGQTLPPLLFHRKFYSNNSDLRQSFPDLECLL